jgi:hypothetical protein
MILNRSGWLEHRRQDVTRLSMSAPSSLPKPFAGFLAASFDAVAIAIAETNVELSSEHALFRTSKIPAKRVAPTLAQAAESSPKWRSAQPNRHFRSRETCRSNVRRNHTSMLTSESLLGLQRRRHAAERRETFEPRLWLVPSSLRQEV